VGGVRASFTTDENDPDQLVGQLVMFDIALELPVGKKLYYIAVLDTHFFAVLPSFPYFHLIAFCSIDMRIVPGPVKQKAFDIIADLAENKKLAAFRSECFCEKLI